MEIPVYVVTGFLGAGKTSFLNKLLSRYEWHNTNIMLIQFEAGEEEFLPRHHACQTVLFSKKELEQQPMQIVQSISDCIQTLNPDEIWVEWNGVAAYSQLQDLLSQPALGSLCRIDKVLHIADASVFEKLVAQTDGILAEQLFNSDLAVIRNEGSVQELKNIKRILKSINPVIQTFTSNEQKPIIKLLSKKKESVITLFFYAVVFIVTLYFVFRPFWLALNIPVETTINIFLGIILQAIPFLLIGVLLSSTIQVLLPNGWLERRFPKSLGLGMLAALAGGFCLPVCDCATIPIFRSLLKKGVPLPVAITFMMAAPIVNPVAILSTWYAFGGGSVVLVCRICLGVIVALLVGLVFAFFLPKTGIMLSGTLSPIMCSCGCVGNTGKTVTIKDRLIMFLRHAQEEFLSVGKYLIIGTFISSVFQTLDKSKLIAQGNSGLAVSILIMMVLAFALSLCSSSDAIIARSFLNQLPLGAIIGFLVLGPMMDIKNITMLSSWFSKSFIIKLLCSVSILCFVVVYLYSKVGGLG